MWGGAGLVEIKGASIYRVEERRGEGSVGSDGMNGRMRRFGKRIELMGCLVSRRKTRESREALLMEGRKEGKRCIHPAVENASCMQ